MGGFPGHAVGVGYAVLFAVILAVVFFWDAVFFLLNAFILYLLVLRIVFLAKSGYFLHFVLPAVLAFFLTWFLESHAFLWPITVFALYATFAEELFYQAYKVVQTSRFINFKRIALTSGGSKW